MTRNRNDNLEKAEKELEDLMNGFRNFFPKNQGLVIGGVTFTLQGFVKELEEHEKLYEDARDARAFLMEKVALREARSEDTARLVRLARKFLVAHYGETSPQLREFGIEPAAKRRPRTAEEKAAAAAKAKATRQRNRGGRGGGGGGEIAA